MSPNVIVIYQLDQNTINWLLDAGPIGELPENWDQAKDDTQSLFLNKSDKNDLEPYPLALSEEGNNGHTKASLTHIQSSLMGQFLMPAVSCSLLTTARLCTNEWNAPSDL